MRLNFVFIARHYLINIMPYYAVARGRNPGIYNTWDECSAQVNKFPDSRYKKFATKSEAQDFINIHGSSTKEKHFTQKQIVKSIESQSLPKQLFSLGRRCAVRNQTSTLSISKRTLSTSSDTGTSPQQASKRRKIVSNRDAELVRSSKQVGKMDFIMDENGYVDVFTDGACSSNGYENARAGIGVWFKDHHPLNVSRPVEGRATNNMAEIQAVTVAARQANKAGIKKLRINTDSKFLITCITEWMPKWKRRGWVTTENKPVINKKELLEMEKELKPLTIAWNHVNGHVGIHGNEMADKLAKEGSLQYKIQNNLD